MTSVSNSSDRPGRRSRLTEAPQLNSSGARGESGHLPEREPSIKDGRVQFHGRPLDADHVCLVLYPEAIEEILEHTASDTVREVGGVLLGTAYQHDHETYVDVHHALPARTSDHGPIHFTLNADAWSQLHRDRAAHYPGLDIVGWFHTHPGLGIFFSADDVVVHSAAFVLPWHVALVVDPSSRRIGAFAWKNGTLVGLPGLYERIESESKASRLPWRVQDGEIWDESYLERMAQRRPRSATPGIVRGLANRWQAAAVIGLALVLLTAVVTGAILQLRGQDETMRAVVTSLAQQNMQEAQARGSASCPSELLRVLAPVPDAHLVVGQEVTLVGTASVPGAAAYRLDVRPADAERWWLMGSFSRSTDVGQLLTWDTGSFPPGEYALRLLAMDDEGRPLQENDACIIRFELLEGASAAQ